MEAEFPEETFFWSEGNEEKLVELWAQHECLYDTTAESFKNRNKKTQALADISASLGASVEEIKKRMQTLRTAYSKLRKPAPSGSSCLKLTKKKIWVIDKMQFLLPYIKSRPSVSNLQGENPETQEADDDFLNLSVSERSSDDSESSSSIAVKHSLSLEDSEPLKRKSKSQKRDEEEIGLLRQLVHAVESNSKTNNRSDHHIDEELQSFSTYVTLSLSKLDTKTRNMAKNMIQNIIFQAEMGYIQHDTNNMTNTVPNNRNDDVYNYQYQIL